GRGRQDLTQTGDSFQAAHPERHGHGECSYRWRRLSRAFRGNQRLELWAPGTEPLCGRVLHHHQDRIYELVRKLHECPIQSFLQAKLPSSPVVARASGHAFVSVSRRRAGASWSTAARTEARPKAWQQSFGQQVPLHTSSSRDSTTRTWVKPWSKRPSSASAASTASYIWPPEPMRLQSEN